MIPSILLLHTCSNLVSNHLDHLTLYIVLDNLERLRALQRHANLGQDESSLGSTALLRVPISRQRLDERHVLLPSASVLTGTRGESRCESHTTSPAEFGEPVSALLLIATYTRPIPPQAQVSSRVHLVVHCIDVHDQ